MNTTEKNKLIAEFIGYEFIDGDFKVPYTNKTDNSDFKEWCPTYWDNDLDSGGYLVAPCNLIFHLDWNWLMEVVGNIRNFHNGTEPLNDKQIEQLSQLIKKLNESLTLRNEVSIEAVYNACVTFIEWYNKNAVKS